MPIFCLCAQPLFAQDVAHTLGQNGINFKLLFTLTIKDMQNAPLVILKAFAKLYLGVKKTARLDLAVLILSSNFF